MIEYKYSDEFSVKDEAQGLIEGYGSIFGNVDRQKDIVEPGAFARSLKASGGIIPMLADHVTPVGFWSASEDSKGLKVSGSLALEVSAAKDTYALVKAAKARGFKPGLSIGYRVEKDSYEGDVRRLKELDLIEVSIVMAPANPKARITSVKAAAEWTEREFEEHLRDVGFSQTAAKTIVSRGFKALAQRDAGSAAVSEWITAQAQLAQLRALLER